MTLYLDASVIIPLVIAEATSATIQAWLVRQSEPFSVGRLAIGEAGSAISRRRRMGELTDAQGERALIAMDEWLNLATSVVDHHAGDIAEAARLVRRPVPKLLTPDAIHLATCRRLGQRLITGDADLTVVAEMLGINWAIPV